MQLRLILISMIFCINGYGHESNFSYLNIDWQKRSAQWDINIIDLDYAISLDQNADNQLTWGELQKQQKKIKTYLLPRLQIKSGSENCNIKALPAQINPLNKGIYYSLRLTLKCKPTSHPQIQVAYHLFYDIDTHHQLLLTLTTATKTINHTLYAKDNRWQINIDQYTKKSTFLHFLKLGMMHVLIGFDHLLFLVTLLLPAVLLWKNKQWLKQPRITTITWSLVKVVSAFSLAHSITLTLATLKVIQWPSHWIEVSIAFSIIVVACNNLYPLVSKRYWLLAFTFGLLHGMGFANVLLNSEMAQKALFTTLLAFNVGVEMGQLLIVTLVIPIIFLLSRWRIYRYIMQISSIIIMLIGAFWLVERLSC